MIVYPIIHLTFMLSVIIIDIYRILIVFLLSFFNNYAQIWFIGILANEAHKNFKFSKKDQFILISGVSGAGKTKNAKHIINFLCKNSQNVSNTSPIFEAFGNARTRGNSNSSRFCKVMEVWNRLNYYFLFVYNAFCCLQIISVRFG